MPADNAEINLDNVPLVGGNAALGYADSRGLQEQADKTAMLAVEGTDQEVVLPPPSNAERAAAKATNVAGNGADEVAKKAEQGAENYTAEDTEDTEGEEKLDTTVWGDAEDDVANSVLLTLQNSGVSPEVAKALLWDAVAEGDPTKVDRDALVECVGKANATLIMAGVENVTTRNNAVVAEITAAAHKAAGGEANWNKAVSWARNALTEEELEDFRALLDRGGKQADFAVKEIINRYNSDSRNTALKAGSGQVKADSKAGAGIKGISRREYGELLDKLYRTGGTEAQYNALRAQRAAGKKQGI